MREIHAQRAAHGPYRFLVRKWDSVSDVDLALRLIETEFFVQELHPQPLPFEKLESLLVIAPHQDDETIGAGGTLLLASKSGAKIDIVFLTDGTPNHHQKGTSPMDTSRIRQEEAFDVCTRLGARMHQLGISNSDPKPTIEDVDQLSEIIHRLRPQVVLAPWILDSPAKHRLVNHLLWLANKRHGLPDFEVWGYQVHNTLFPNGYVDITSVANEKRSLLECYRSQNEVSKRYDHLAMGMGAWNSRFLETTEPKYLELFFVLPIHDVLRMVEQFYLPDISATYRGHKAVISGASALHSAVMSGTLQNRKKGSRAI